MYILDSDVLGFYLNYLDNYPHLCQRIAEADAKKLLCTSIVTVEEAIAGKLSYLRRAETQKSIEVIQGYKYLLDFISDISRFLILPFDQQAYEIFQTIPRSVRESAVNDCRIAAIALSRSATVVTNNGKAFSRIEAATSVPVAYWVNAP
ncbi:MAG: type II toxin-antitoxin system VapC family toxin [Acidobacteria bacterium]|nr:type II toxin-antitoxin system VapC family toxin [Acidobacteriota bacterium]